MDTWLWACCAGRWHYCNAGPPWLTGGGQGEGGKGGGNWMWVKDSVGEDCCKNERGGGEERVEQLSYYKKDRTDNMMNEWTRKTSRRQAGSSPARKLHLILYTWTQHLKRNFNVAQHYSILIVLYTNFAYCRPIRWWSVASCAPVCTVCIYASEGWRALHACWAAGLGQVWSGSSGKTGNSGPVN